VQDYPRPGERHETWSVFDSTGHWLSVVRMPQNLTLLQVGHDFLLGTRTDSSGGRHVLLHQLIRSATVSSHRTRWCPRTTTQ
jgi:hypothetical protein